MRLRDTQRLFAEALMAPDAEAAARAAALLRPSASLPARARFDIYRRSYWSRVLESLQDDFPGLLAIVGKRRFQRLATAYLRAHPSRSFTLRDLGSRLPGWLRANAVFAGEQYGVALDMARLEWAHIEAFDGPMEEALGPADLAELRPDLSVGLQPYLQLLDLRYPVDALRVQAKDGVGRGRYLIAVHRLDGVVHYRRLHIVEYRVLRHLRAGRLVGEAVGLATGGDETAETLRVLEEGFAAWARYGWLTRSGERKGRKG